MNAVRDVSLRGMYASLYTVVQVLNRFPWSGAGTERWSGVERIRRLDNGACWGLSIENGAIIMVSK